MHQEYRLHNYSLTELVNFINFTMLPDLESFLLVSLLAVVMAATPPNVVLFLVHDVGVYCTSV